MRILVFENLSKVSIAFNPWSNAQLLDPLLYGRPQGQGRTQGQIFSHGSLYLWSLWIVDFQFVARLMATLIQCGLP